MDAADIAPPRRPKTVAGRRDIQEGMKVAIAAFGLLGCVGCVRVAETTVREQAAHDFACAHYALSVVEVGPDVYRASGCGQELIYACSPAPRATSEDAEEAGEAAPVSCARTLE